MINLNLIPQDLRQTKGQGLWMNFTSGLAINFIYGLGFLLVVGVLAVHLVTAAIWISRLTKHATLKAQWYSLTPDKNSMDKIGQEVRDLKKKIDAISEILPKNVMPWSQRFNIISDRMVKGVWINKIDYRNYALTMEGNAYNKSKQEAVLVGDFVNALKKDTDFMAGLASLELDNIHRAKKGDTEIAGFILTLKWPQPIRPPQRKK